MQQKVHLWWPLIYGNASPRSLEHIDATITCIQEMPPGKARLHHLRTWYMSGSCLAGSCIK